MTSAHIRCTCPTCEKSFEYEVHPLGWGISDGVCFNVHCKECNEYFKIRLNVIGEVLDGE